MSIRPKYFLLIIGNSRSGSTLIGSVLDNHNQMVISNESETSRSLWARLDRKLLFKEILENSANNYRSKPLKGDYDYAIDGALSPYEKDVKVIGDKIWNPAMLLLHGDHSLLNRIQDCVGIPIKIINSIRNPFDIISTMSKRSGAPLSDRIKWCFNHFEASVAIRENHLFDNFMNIYHEDFLSVPEETIGTLCEFLGVDCPHNFLLRIEKILFKSPNKTRYETQWDKILIDQVENKIKTYECLSRYSYTD